MEPGPAVMPHRGRFFTIVVALGVFVAAGAFAWRAFGSASSSGGAPDVARVDCSEEGASVVTPVVQVQPDGVHLEIHGEGKPSGLILTSTSGTVSVGFTPEETYPASVVLTPPVGHVQVSCGRDEPVGQSGSLRVTDPEGIWHGEQLTCMEAGDAWGQRGIGSFFPSVNPMPDAISRTIGGVLESDEVSYSGYPNAEFVGSYRIIRDEQAVALFELVQYDDRVFVNALMSCDASGIGLKDSVPAGMLATPFEVLDYARCDPYVSSCSTVFVTAEWYAGIRSETADTYAYVEEPWMACIEEQPQGCPGDPDELVLEIRLRPAESEAFIASNGCGATRQEPCS